MFFVALEQKMPINKQYLGLCGPQCLCGKDSPERESVWRQFVDEWRLCRIKLYLKIRLQTTFGLFCVVRWLLSANPVWKPVFVWPDPLEVFIYLFVSLFLFGFKALSEGGEWKEGGREGGRGGHEERNRPYVVCKAWNLCFRYFGIICCDSKRLFTSFLISSSYGWTWGCPFASTLSSVIENKRMY